MRKSVYDEAGAEQEARLQCGRIYKDAEMRMRATQERLQELPSMWPHL